MSKQNEQNVSDKREYTGSSVSYYRVNVAKPTSKDLAPYTAECNDIIKALKMNYAEGNAFKAIWRSCAARNLGLAKKGYDSGLYDAEKVVFFGNDMVEQAQAEQHSLLQKLVAEFEPPVTKPKHEKTANAVYVFHKEDFTFYDNVPYQSDWLWMRTRSNKKYKVSRLFANTAVKLKDTAMYAFLDKEGIIRLEEEFETQETQNGNLPAVPHTSK